MTLLPKETELQSLYGTPLSATRNGALYNAHWYPTKISPESVALMIATHTKPGDTVFDGFGGSCTTALGTMLCSKPNEELIKMAEKLGLNPQWGARNASVYELTGLGAFIGQTFCSKPNPEKFSLLAEEVLTEAEKAYGWMYECGNQDSESKVANHYFWSEILVCAKCKTNSPLWDVCVSLEPARISDTWTCPSCGNSAKVGSSERKFLNANDPLLNTSRRSKVREISRIDGGTGRAKWSRPVNQRDMELLDRIEDERIPDSVPVTPMMNNDGKERWGDLWRSGYHEGITHVHHFYTRRNLIALGYLYKLVRNIDSSLRDPLLFWLSSFNSSHSTLMTRAVAKRDQKHLSLTSAQPGVLYISGLPIERNVFIGLRRKIGSIKKAFEVLRETKGNVQVFQGSSTKTRLKKGSVDYVFTDPPFGGNIPYSEVNFISEAWLGRITENKKEAIVSPSQSKDINDYENLLGEAFKEVRRILRPDGYATVVFHSTQAKVWRAFTNAYRKAGLGVVLSNILDKKQGSFKQVTSKNSAKGDPIILLAPKDTELGVTEESGRLIKELVKSAKAAGNEDELSSERIYSRFIEYYLKQHSSPPVDAEAFYTALEIERGHR